MHVYTLQNDPQLRLNSYEEKKLLHPVVNYKLHNVAMLCIIKLLMFTRVRAIHNKYLTSDVHMSESYT